MESKLDLLIENLSEFYKNTNYMEKVKSIIEQNSDISLRILDWFITSYAKRNQTVIPVQHKPTGFETIDIYQKYKLQLKSYSKKQFDPFCRKNKIMFYYDNNNNFIETSCGQLCFFKWCFENNILEYVEKNINNIEKDMKQTLEQQKHLLQDTGKKRKRKTNSATSKSISTRKISGKLQFP